MPAQVVGQVARLLSKNRSKPRKVDKLLEDMPPHVEDLIRPEMRGASWVTKEEAKEAKENFQKFVNNKFDETGQEDPLDLLVLAELEDIIEGNVRGIKPTKEILGKGWKGGKDNEAYALRFIGNETEREIFQRSFIPSYDNWASKKEAQISSWLTKTEEGKKFQLETFGQLIAPLSETSLMKKGKKPTTNELDTRRKLKTDNTSDVTLEDIDRYDFKDGGNILKMSKKRKKYQEGGDIDDQMKGLAISVEPVTLKKETEDYDNIPMESDEDMEEGFVDYVVSTSLSEEEQNYLEDALLEDDQLSQIFDKVVTVASEFSGSGPVEGPGTEVSDSIPARLSDGEFVFTAKATEEIGADNLQQMMEDAEASADQRQTAAYGGLQTEKEDEIVAPIQTTGLRAARRNVPVVAPTKRQVEEEMLKSSPRRFYQPLSG